MKYLTLIGSLIKKNIKAQFLISLEMIIGLILFFVCANMLYSFRVRNVYYEKYKDIAVIDTRDSAQVEYANANGISLGKDRSLNIDNENFRGHLFSIDFYKNTPLDLVKGEWFSGNREGCDLEAVIPYSLRNKYKCGQVYNFSIYKWGKVKVYICGVLTSDNTIANSGEVDINDANKIVLFCDSSGITSDLENVESMEYYLIENASMEELALHGINSIGIANEVEKSGQRHELAVPAIFMVILFVMFTVAFFGEQFLSLVEREKLFAVQFMCGATRQKTFVIQMCYDIIWLLIPFVIAIAATLIIGIRLHLLGVILPFAYLLIGFLITTGISLSVTSNKSPIEIINRRFRT